MSFKVLGAQRAGVSYFLVPAAQTWQGYSIDNYGEALACQCAGAMTLVPVRTLSQTLDFLRHLG